MMPIGKAPPGGLGKPEIKATGVVTPPSPAPEPAADEKPAPIKERVLVLPVRSDRETVEYFDIPVESAVVLINYHDLAKVRVRATEAALDDLASKAASHVEEG